MQPDPANGVFIVLVFALVIISLITRHFRKRGTAKAQTNGTQAAYSAAGYSTTPQAPKQAQKPAQQATRQAQKVEYIVAPLPLKDVVEYLTYDTDTAPHCFIVGGTGAGKSTFAKLLLSARVANGEQYIILTGKRSQAFAGLPAIGRDGVGDYSSIETAAAGLLQEIARRDNLPLDQRDMLQPLTVVLDDATILLAECEPLQSLFREAALIGREINIRLMVILGSLRVKELGIEGRGDLREHFAVVTYDKRLDGSRTTTIRPRFDDDYDVTPFDAESVPLIQVSVPASAAWVSPAEKARKDREALLGLLVPTNEKTYETYERTYGTNGAEMAHTERTYERTDDLSKASADEVKRALVEYMIARNVNRTKARDVLKGSAGDIGKLFDEVEIEV